MIQKFLFVVLSGDEEYYTSQFDVDGTTPISSDIPVSSLSVTMMTSPLYVANFFLPSSKMIVLPC